MTTEELAELFLVALYDLAEAAPHPYYLFSVNEFAPTMGVTDLRELSKAMVHLESRGLTFSASMDAIGGISAGITPDGTAYVENGGETGIIGRYRENPAAFRVEVERPLPPVEEATVRSVDPPPYAQPRPLTGDAIEPLLSGITANMWRDASLPEDLRKDLLLDIETMKLQLNRKVKNRAVIGAMLDSLIQVPSVASLVRQLTPLVMG